MVLMALNRYYKIVKPAKYQSVFTKKFIISTALAVWATLIVLSLVCVLAFGFPNHVCPAFALPLSAYGMPIALPALLFITYFPYPVFAFCYWKVYSAVKMHNGNLSWQSANVEDVRVSKILFITVVGFVSLWLPSQTIYLVSYYVRLPRQLALLATLSVFSSSFINPFVYGFMNRSFRNEFKKCLSLKKKQSISMESGPI
ncbi:somatostatin receptor type 5-like [Stylophora pistillata]|uniref:somatostatin receptor type 5-like n=1 Tax=Stylophora pistillata TaxID=50429 RepID=UPI000C057506|nr:somatostatin receptor type 5-like [Stylophora pistillata]